MTTDEMIKRLQNNKGDTLIHLGQPTVAAMIRALRSQEARLRAADALAFAMAHRSLPDQQWALEDYRNAGKGEG